MSAALQEACFAPTLAGAAKTFRNGTHRAATPAETLARVRPLAAGMGITRLGNVTGLDHVGIPVAIAVRPRSRAVAVAQGKGIALDQAMASALMEAVEGFHAERSTERAMFASHRAVSSGPIAVADPLLLGANRLGAGTVIPWMLGHDLLRDEPCWVPAELVHTDFTAPLHEGAGYFLASSNGLGAGNHIAEALISALCELVERDAVALWKACGLRARARRALDPASVDDATCCALLARYRAAGIGVRLWDVTGDIGLATFVCDISADSETTPGALRRFRGAGCHPDPAIALVRALTEAAQCRLTYITGVRDDLPAAAYALSPDAEIEEALLDALHAAGTPLHFSAAPRFQSDDLGADLRWALDRLATAGFTRAVAVDLTRPEIGIPVVRVVIPGLESFSSHPQYQPGARAKRAVARSEAAAPTSVT